MTMINRQSFAATGEPITTTYANGYRSTYTDGTVEVTLRGQNKRVKAILYMDDQIYAYGLVGRYQSATKLWPAYITSCLRDGKIIETVNFGRDDRHDKFRKENNVWFV